MSKLALAVQTFPGGNETLARHWEHFKRAGADQIIVITTTDGGCVVPENAMSEPIGANIYITGSHLPRRLLRTFQHLVDMTKADWFCVAEYDVLFFKPIPRDLPLGLTTHLAGHEMPGHYCKHFYHNPWVCDRDTAMHIVMAGYDLIAKGTVDASPDCFMGQIMDVTGIPVHTDILKSYSRNTIHPPWDVEARAAVDAGAVCVHGVKDLATFEALTR